MVAEKPKKKTKVSAGAGGGMGGMGGWSMAGWITAAADDLDYLSRAC